MPAYALTESVELKARNTLRVSARCKYWVDILEPACLPDILALPELDGLPLMAMGEGSNVLIRADYPGAMLHFTSDTVHVIHQDEQYALIDVDAGKSWHAWVLDSLAHGWYGLENLALIPGTVGAAPIQNIGAYGVEVGEFIEHVRVFDRKTGRFAELDHRQCAFAYRDSVFKQHPLRFLVTAVRFRLSRSQQPRLDYPGIREQLGSTQQVSCLDVANAVIAIRQRKLPQPAQLPNAGSFFKNPIVDSACHDRLRAQFPDMPSWPAGGMCKLSAAWLIERAGLKGVRQGDAGIAAKHALVLVNHGHASGTELLAMARTVQDRVAEQFGIQLIPEPVFV